MGLKVHDLETGELKDGVVAEPSKDRKYEIPPCSPEEWETIEPTENDIKNVKNAFPDMCDEDEILFQAKLTLCAETRAELAARDSAAAWSGEPAAALHSMAAASALRLVRVEEPSTEYALVLPPPPPALHARRAKWSACALLAVAGLVLGVMSWTTGTPWRVRSDAAAHLLAPAASDGPLSTAMHDKAHIIIIRHGEKDTRKSEKGEGLSDVGEKRAQYLARCMSQPMPTVAMPFGPPTYVMASHGKPSKSHRPIDTVRPRLQPQGCNLKAATS